uniref:Mitochondrial genome maintenance protein MGM101 n=2 Tax=Bionectria ochroleuca TaxID=29856 RepID=A0A0B7JXJ2_BIOOC
MERAHSQQQLRRRRDQCQPAAHSPQKPAPPRPEPAALDQAGGRNEAQASRPVPGTPGRPFPSKDLPQEIRAPTSPMKNTYEAKTVTVSHPKEHATANDIDVPWDASFHGISTRPVTAGQFKVLMRPIDEEDIEVKPDGIIYLPEIKYRRRLNEAFGPMGWGMIPKSDPIINGPMVTREYALIVDGRFVSQAQGENHFYNEEGIPSAVEGCKSNALMRCCKDLGIASDLWDPRFIRSFKKEKMEEVWVEHQVTKKKRVLWFKKGQVEVAYPFKRT